MGVADGGVEASGKDVKEAGPMESHSGCYQSVYMYLVSLSLWKKRSLLIRTSNFDVTKAEPILLIRFATLKKRA